VSEWVVLWQIPEGPWADSWTVVYVNVEAETPQDAVEQTALDRGAGRYVALPIEYWVGYNAEVKKIAEVSLEQEDLA